MLTVKDDEDISDCVVLDTSKAGEKVKCLSLNEALDKASLKTQPTAEKEILLFVQRRHALKNAFEDLKSCKMATSKMSVEFVGEPAVDTGGPTKELFAIAFLQVIDSKITRGAFPNITFLHDQNSLVSGDYRAFGQLVALSLLNGAGGPHIFSPCVAHFILGTEENSPIEDVNKELPRDQSDIVKLQNLNECKKSEDWAKALMDFDERFDMGINRPTAPFDEKEKVIRAAVKHIMISSVLEESYSFQESLSSFGVLSILKQYPEEAYRERTYMEVNVEDVRKPFPPRFSVSG